MRIAIVGTRDEVRGFALAGVEPVVCEDAASIAPTLEQIENDRDLAVILITDHTARVAPDAVRHLEARVTPPIPCRLGAGRERGGEPS